MYMPHSLLIFTSLLKVKCSNCSSMWRKIGLRHQHQMIMMLFPFSIQNRNAYLLNVDTKILYMYAKKQINKKPTNQPTPPKKSKRKKAKQIKNNNNNKKSPRLMRLYVKENIGRWSPWFFFLKFYFTYKLTLKLHWVKSKLLRMHNLGWMQHLSWDCITMQQHRRHHPRDFYFGQGLCMCRFFDPSVPSFDICLVSSNRSEVFSFEH